MLCFQLRCSSPQTYPGTITLISVPIAKKKRLIINLASYQLITNKNCRIAEEDATKIFASPNTHEQYALTGLNMKFYSFGQ